MDFKALVPQLVHLFQRLNRSQRIVIGVTITAVIGFIVFLILYSGKAEDKDGYKVLFDRLSPADAALVVGQLQKDGIAYKLVDESTISVPKEVVYEERIKIASLGLPKDNRVGFELFDNQEFGATSFDQNVKYLRALEGELARTVEALRPISKATVHLALPKESVFVSKQVEPTASIAIVYSPNMRLTKQQVQGIKNLVASSVPKMTPANVTVVDADGVSLGEGDAFMESSERAKTQMLYQKRMEKAYEEKIVKVLAPFIGSEERVVAKVTMEFDFSQKDIVEEVFDPENVVRSEQILEEKREGFKPKEIGGVPGAVSNIGPVEGLNGKNTTEKYSKNKTATNYEISKKVSNIKGAFATLKRMTAAVVVDGKYTEIQDDAGEFTGEYAYSDLPQSQIDAISNLVKQSIGIDNARGDEVSVSNFAFNKTKSQMRPQAVYDTFIESVEHYAGPITPFLKYIFVAIVLFIFYKKVITPFAERMLEIEDEEDELNKPLLDLDEEEDEDLVVKVQAMRRKVEDQLGVNENFNEEALKHEVLLEKIKTIVEDRPEEVATLLQVLIEEEQNVVDNFDMKGAK
jgi:flagellar M-ring protein FliF